MAQPGNFTPILLYSSSTSTNVPLAANLTNSVTGSEIAINIADKNLFFKDSGGTVNTVPIRQSSTSSNGWLSSTDWNTFNNKQTALVSGTNIKTVGGVSLLGSGDVGIISGTYGGTGINNGANTITIAGNLTYAGAFTQSYTATANTAVTLPAGATASSNNLLSSATAVGIVTGTPSSTTYLRGDGTWTSVTASSATNLAGGALGSVPYQLLSGSTTFLAGNTTTTPQFITSTGVAGLATAPTYTSSTGSGNVVLATSPTLVSPALGTPASGIVTNLTGTASININGTVGATTPTTGKFTTLTSTSNVINGATSGSITLAVPAISGSNTATLPAATGTVMVSGNMPAFSAYLNAAQTVTSGVYTKVAFNTKAFDTATAYDNVTNFRFTPQVAGYYQVNSLIQTVGTTTQSVYINAIYKNGSVYRYGTQTAVTFTATGTNGFAISDLISMNGTTDYLEVYCRIDGTGTMQIVSGVNQSAFSAVLVRSA